MPNFSNFGERSRTRSVFTLNRLVEIGWINNLVIRDMDNTFDFDWTEKGKDCAAQLAKIIEEFHGGPEDLLALVSIYHSHRPN